MKPIISAKDLSKWYGEVIGLNSLNLDIYPGITGIVGPNGGGKSTFLKLVMGLIKPRMGEIEVLGEDPWKNSGINAKIGFCPDYDSLPLDSTGHDYLRLIASLHFISSTVGKSMKWKMQRRRKASGSSFSLFEVIIKTGLCFATISSLVSSTVKRISSSSRRRSLGNSRSALSISSMSSTWRRLDLKTLPRGPSLM